MSTNYTKTVRVVTALQGDGEVFDELDEVAHIKFNDGHLILSDGDHMVLAAYAPRDWMRVKRQTSDN